MPFALSNAPASFQAFVNPALAEKFDIFVVAYLKGILIYTDGEGQGHVDSVKCVLENLRMHGGFRAPCGFTSQWHRPQ